MLILKSGTYIVEPILYCLGLELVHVILSHLYSDKIVYGSPAWNLNNNEIQECRDFNDKNGPFGHEIGWRSPRERGAN